MWAQEQASEAVGPADIFAARSAMQPHTLDQAQSRALRPPANEMRASCGGISLQTRTDADRYGPLMPKRSAVEQLRERGRIGASPGNGTIASVGEARAGLHLIRRPHTALDLADCNL